MSDESIGLPEGWEWVKLGECCEARHGYAFKSEDFGDSGAIVLTPGNFTERGELDFTNKRVVRLNADCDKQWILKNGDLLVVMTDLSQKKQILGIATILDSNETVLHNQRIGLIVPYFEDINRSYLRYAISSSQFKKYVDSTATGTLITHTSPTKLLNGSISLPPIAEQKRIVAKIEELRSRTQKAREALEEIPKLCDRFRQSVLAAAFRGDLTADWREQNPDVEPASILSGELQNGLPSSWYFALVGDVIESLKYGTSKKCSYEMNGVPVLRIPNIGDGIIIHDGLKYAELPEKELQELKLIPGDILIIRSNGSVSLVGKSAVIRADEKDFAYAGYLIRLRLKQSLIDSDYLNSCLLSHDLRLQIEIPAKSTSGVHNINSQEVKKLRVPVPPIAEQAEIVDRIQKLFVIVDRIHQQYEQAKARLEKLDRSILAQAFRGELVPQDPNDEPASVLLDRIREERAKLSDRKPAKRKR